jgi:hypothetical protein
MGRLQRAAAEIGIHDSRSLRLKVVATLCAVLSFSSYGTAYAATLGHMTVSLSDPRPSQTGVTYAFTGGDGANPVTSSAIKCIKVVIAASSTSTTAPVGYSGASGSVDAANSTLINSSATGWTLAKSDGASSSGQNNIYQYTNSTGVTPSTTTGATFVLLNITNGSFQNVPYYFRIDTFGNTDCATSPIDNAFPQFIYTSASILSLTVDPTLSFTVNAVAAAQSCDGTTTTTASTPTSIPFGTVTPASNSVVCQDLIAATNATNGYTIYIRYTGAPANALAQTIANSSGSNASPTPFSSAGTEAYGYSTNDSTLGSGTANRFTNPSQGWAALTTTNNEVAYEPTGTTNTTYRIAHQVGISTSTLAGTYQTTVLYTCTPVY